MTGILILLYALENTVGSIPIWCFVASWILFFAKAAAYVWMFFAKLEERLSDKL